LTERSAGRLGLRASYLAITIAAIALVWLADIFEIISIASRTFAFYYLLQTINAWIAAERFYRAWPCILARTRFGGLIVILSFVVFFGRAVE
jgi:hypothetical protein